MDRIDIKIMNPEAIKDAERAMVAAAKLTQHGHEISDPGDFCRIYDQDPDPELVHRLCSLPHPTLQKFGVINVFVAGLSRRALAQITRHQNEVKFMAGSLQYSDYSKAQQYVYPPGLDKKAEELFSEYYRTTSALYDHLIDCGYPPDTAGYVMPQGFRTALLISATLFQWKHMIGQRTCRRNTPEVRYIFLRIGEALIHEAPEMFPGLGPGCKSGGVCSEGKFYCGTEFAGVGPELDLMEYGWLDRVSEGEIAEGAEVEIPERAERPYDAFGDDKGRGGETTEIPERAERPYDAMGDDEGRGGDTTEIPKNLRAAACGSHYRREEG